MSKSAARKAAQKVVSMTECEICGATEKLNRHHVDYENYTEVIILCASCHAKIHQTRAREVEVCIVCEKTFIPTHSKKGHKLCSRECVKIFGKICAMKRWHGGKWSLLYQELQKHVKTE